MATTTPVPESSTLVLNAFAGVSYDICDSFASLRPFLAGLHARIFVEKSES